MPHEYLIPLAALLCVQRTNLCHQEVVEIFKFLQVPLHELSYLLLMVSGRLYRYRCIERTRTSSSAKELFCKTTQCCRFSCVMRPVAHCRSCCASCWCQKQLKNWHKRSQERGDFWCWGMKLVLSWLPASGLSMSVHQCAHIPMAPATNSRDRERSKSYQMLNKSERVLSQLISELYCRTQIPPVPPRCCRLFRDGIGE